MILGIDPGIALLGYGLVRLDGDAPVHLDHGCIETPARLPQPARLRLLYEGVAALKQAFSVTDVAMEALFYSRNVSTVVTVGQARGVALLAAVDETTVFGEYTPTEVKQVVAGFGRARKPQVQAMVGLLLGLRTPPSPDDAADALAVALCHARRVTLDAVLTSSALGRVGTP
ncbi:MAG: crossover junction endodeoxyribonuclease RuvC [Chloroflexi bacterium]|nr:crossover junction endodeoxyribonuclease RuvC [Chloroflexota bacterium]